MWRLWPRGLRWSDRRPRGRSTSRLRAGCWESRPRVMTTGDWLSELDPNDEIAALPSPVREKLVGDGAAWPDDYVVVKGCSEGAAILQEAMEEAPALRQVLAWIALAPGWRRNIAGLPRCMG